MAKRKAKRRVSKKFIPQASIVSDEIYIPNHSGLLDAGQIHKVPDTDFDPVNKKYVDNTSIGSDVTLYLSNDVSDIANYFDLKPVPTGEAESSVGVVVPANDTLIKSFASIVGCQCVSSIQLLIAGTYDAHFHAQSTKTGCKIYAELYKRTAGGTETLLSTAETSNDITVSSSSGYNIHFTVSDEITWASTDRVVVKYYANPGVGANPTVTLFMEGETSSRLTLKTTAFSRLHSSLGNLDWSAADHVMDDTLDMNDNDILDVKSMGVGTDSPQKKLHVAGGGIMADGGSSGNPSYSFTDDGNLGFYRPADNEIGFTVLGSEVMRLNSTGLGIGTTDPDRKIHVNSGTTDIGILTESSDSGAYIAFKDNSTTADTYVRIGAIANGMDFKAGNVTRLTLDNSGTSLKPEFIVANGMIIRSQETYDDTSANAANVYINSSGRFWRATSSLKWKENITDIEIDSKKIYDLRPVSFDSKSTADYGKRFIGLIAEEVFEILPECVQLDKAGKPDGIQWDKITVAMLNEIKKLREEIDTLKNNS